MCHEGFSKMKRNREKELITKRSLIADWTLKFGYMKKEFRVIVDK